MVGICTLRLLLVHPLLNGYQDISQSDCDCGEVPSPKFSIFDSHVREYHPHSSTIEHLLDKPDATLKRHPNKRRQTTEKPCAGDRAGICEGDCRMLQIDKKGVKTGVLC
jgi:hypothetical protein